MSLDNIHVTFSTVPPLNCWP